MVHWVYVLKSSQTGGIYVGETTRLYRRWNEHARGRGGVTTSQDEYDILIGLYHVGHNWSFGYIRSCIENGDGYSRNWANYWDEERGKEEARKVEDRMTGRYRHEYCKKNWWDVRGGKYCTHHGLIDESDIELIRPLCKCGYVSEVKMTKDQLKVYFTCPVPTWTEFGGMKVPNTCNFYQEFEPYRTLREKSRSDYAKKMQSTGLAAFLEDTNDEFRQPT